MRYNTFLSHLVAVSFPKKVISIGISNPAPIPLVILVPVTLQLARQGKSYLSYSLLNSLLQNKELSPI